MRLWPQVFFGVRSAGRVRLSDHPRETHPNISSARKYWGPRECPCLARHGRAGTPSPSRKGLRTSTPGKTPLQTILQAPLFYHPPTRPGGDFAALRSRDAEHRRSGPVRHPPAHKVRRAPRQFTRNNSRKRESPGNSVDLFAHQRASRGLIAPAAFALRPLS